MNQIVPNESTYELALFNEETYNTLQIIQDENERLNQPKFNGFTDLDIIYWYIHQRKNIDATKEKNDRTKYEYERELKQFISNLLTYADDIQFDIQAAPDNSLLKLIEPRHLRRYQDWLVTKSPYVQTGKQYSPATLSRKTTIIKSFFTFLFESGYSPYNASTGLRVASVRSDDRPNRDLGSIETTRILDTLRKVDLRYYTIVLTLVTTGLRNEELCKLTVGSVKEDWINGGYYLEVVGKGNKRRDIPIKEGVLNKIRYYRKSYKLSPIHPDNKLEPLFVTRNNRAFSPSYLSQALKKIITENVILESDVQVTAHSFRHAFAIISHMNKVDIYDIMRSLGHEKIDTTMIYLEKVQARTNNAINSWSSSTLGEHLD